MERFRPRTRIELSRTILAYGPLPSFKADAGKLLDAASHDKKNRAGVRRFVLPEEIGNASVVENVTDTELIAAINWMLARVRES